MSNSRKMNFLEREKILKNISDYKSITISKDQIEDILNIKKGIYYPLNGFLKEDDFISVCKKMRLGNGKIWPIPIVLDITEDIYQRIKNEKDIILKDQTGKLIAFLKDIEIYFYDKKFFVENVFGTKNNSHPGVNEVYKMGDYLVGGEVLSLSELDECFPDYNFSPEKTKEYFKEKGWETICAFQTRNVPHRGHEFLQKEALRMTDGLFIHPVVGRKKMEDFKDEYIIAAYEILIERYYPKDRVLFGVLPLRMKYAGPREALLHALIRKNFGCTHFIVGRDHAGVDNFYSSTAAQEIFDKFNKEEIGIEILKFPEVVYCQSCRKHIFIDNCPHSEQERIHFSGTKIREKIKNKEMPPAYLIRPEIYYLLSKGKSLVDDFYHKDDLKTGFCLWFTGLSQSGKTTIADEIYHILSDKGLKVERLDGDIVRQTLTKDLGFTKEDREENLRRVGSLVRLFVQRGVIVIASFISPYRKSRRELRKRIPNFIEVFVNCPLEICEKRDKKGLYKKAREGKIKNFTGISDPYEPPENPEIEINTSQESVENSAKRIIKYLENTFLKK